MNLGWQVQDLDRKVRRGRERLAQDVDLANVVPISTEKSDQLAAIEEKIKRLLEQSENLGEEGKVDEAQALMKKVIKC
jgi:GTPase Era involved in 16S rRNA processing